MAARTSSRIDGMTTFSRGEWIAISGIVGVILTIMLGVVALLYVQYQILSGVEDELETKIDRVNAELKADMAELKTEMVDLRSQFDDLRVQLAGIAESIDSRLDEVEIEQARLGAVNDLLAEKLLRE